MLACLLGLLFVAAPVVEVDVSGLDGSDEVAGRVLERALEAGFTLSPDAPHRLELRTTEGAVEVVLRIADERWTQRVATDDRDPELVRLAVAQYVVAMVQAHVDDAPIPDGAVRIADDLETAEHEELLLALVAQGVPVTNDASAERVACFGRDASGARVAFAEDQSICAAALADVDGTNEIDDSVTAALKREQGTTMEESWPDDPVSDTPAPEVEDKTVSPPDPSLERAEQPRPMPEHRWGPPEGLLLVEGGIAARPKIAGRFGLAALAGRRIGPIGTVEVAGLPTRGELDFRVFDTSLAGGFGWRWAIGARARIALLGLAGVRLHSFGFPGQPMSTAADVSVATPVRIEWRPVPRLSLGARIAPAFDGRSRRHVTADEDIWQRGPWRLDVGLSIGVILGGR